MINMEAMVEAVQLCRENIGDVIVESLDFGMTINEIYQHDICDTYLQLAGDDDQSDTEEVYVHVTENYTL